MYIEELQLRNYRNYQGLEATFENKVNVILGENAQGKTNVMESIYVLAMAKSHRTSNDKDLIRWDEEYAKIEGRIKKTTDLCLCSLSFRKKARRLKSIISNSGS
ncbi:AAA family ATPase [Mesobacillus selenatarsenatis]|uniref:AAA family ATPase n=1 Tax=Mesobacillus selenatarsenatis TaxID=388741 RepID=UPI000AC32CBE|nr:AAA family ATPase [Mesobacillus selenatarsenatis]